MGQTTVQLIKLSYVGISSKIKLEEEVGARGGDEYMKESFY